MATSNSQDNKNDNSDTSAYQLGGTFLGALGSWATCVTISGTDLSGQG